MGSVRVRKETNSLYIDFRYRGVRCREQTSLSNTNKNHTRLKRLLKNIERDIKNGIFSYRQYFPQSSRVEIFEPNVAQTSLTNHIQTEIISSTSVQALKTIDANHCLPTFSNFADQWYKEKEVSWKRSQRTKVIDILNKHIIPRFRGRPINKITKAEILAFRVYLAREYNKGKGLSPSRINQILNTLGQILAEASDRFEFTSPFRGIKPLKVPRTKVDPLSFDEVKEFLSHVPQRYRNYYVVAFFTGMRTSELMGLKTRYLDFERREIQISETLVQGFEDTPKTDGSERGINMSSIVEQALRDEVSNAKVKSEFVFHTTQGKPFNYRNITRRIWYPTLEKLELRRRRPYQTRHTAATLWLASGENPEWIARQMGHTTTKMLFTVYSRYVPNLTRKDGSAIEQLLSARFGT